MDKLAVAQAAPTVRLGPCNPHSRATRADAMLLRSMGIAKGDSRRAPDSASTRH